VSARSTEGATGADPADRVPILHRPLTSYYLVIGCAAALLILGLAMVFSASSVRAYASSGSSYTVVAKQALWVGIGLPALVLAMWLPPATYRWFGYPLLLISLLGLLAVLVPGVGHKVDGATRWIDVGPVSYQPSELSKLALALWGADLLARKERMLGQWRHLVVPLLPVTALIAALIMLEPDLGTTLIVVIVAMALLWVVGAPLRLFGAISATVTALTIVLVVIEPYRMQRFTGFLDPFADPQHTGYQAIQGLYALSSGGWWGIGIGASREKWLGGLPNAHTDYVFAIIGEELGLAGTFAVLLLFATLAYAGIRTARRTSDPFVRLAATGVTAWLVGQAVVNMGAVVGLLPITGIPLPLISFGGSALVPTLFAIGMLASFARSEPGAAAALAARRSGSGAGWWVRRGRPAAAAPVSRPERVRSRGHRVAGYRSVPRRSVSR
jgi:cell division protein FtsW